MGIDRLILPEGTPEPLPQPPPTPRTKLVMPTRWPTRKLITGTGVGVTSTVVIGKQFATIFVYFLESALGHPIPAAVADSFAMIFEWAIGLGLGILAGYYTPPGANDVPVEVSTDGPGQ